MPNVKVVDVNRDNLYDFAHCFLQNRKHPGYIAKTNWLKKRLSEGLRYKLLVADHMVSNTRFKIILKEVGL